MHVIEQFNGGLYDTIIASDEKFINDETAQNDYDETSNKKSKIKILALERYVVNLKYIHFL